MESQLPQTKYLKQRSIELQAREEQLRKDLLAYLHENVSLLVAWEQVIDSWKEMKGSGTSSSDLESIMERNTKAKEQFRQKIRAVEHGGPQGGTGLASIEIEQMFSKIN